MEQFARTWAWTVLALAAAIVLTTFSLIVAASFGFSPVTTMPLEQGDTGSMSEHAPTHRNGFVRFMTYNMRWGLGSDGVNLARIASVLQEADADVVLLTEVDVNWRRSNNVDQPAYLAHVADYPYSYYGPALRTWASGNRQPSYYGNLLLSRYPIVHAETVALPRPSGSEPRAVIVADILINDETVTVLGTHLGLSDSERMQQLEHIREIIGINSARTVLMGDFNARPESAEVRRLVEKAGLLDTQALTGAENNTFPYPEPYARIDYIFVSPDMADGVLRSEALFVAGSDHLPVVADIARPERDGPPLASSSRSR